MNVVAINGSPHMGGGSTALVLEPFLDGMSGAGAQVERLYARKLNVHACQGDGHCWVRVPGTCVYDDDLTALVPRMAAADELVSEGRISAETLADVSRELVPLDAHVEAGNAWVREALNGARRAP